MIIKLNMVMFYIFLTLVNNDGTVDIYLNIETYEVRIEFNN